MSWVQQDPMAHHRRRPEPEPDSVIVVMAVQGTDGSVRSVAGVFPKNEGGSFKPGDKLLSVKVVEE